MRPYEVMVIFDPALEEQAIQARVDDSTKLIETRGGDPGGVERWGKRRLAYEINHERDGYYVLISANAEPETMSELSHALQLADDVLRYKVIRIPDKIAAGKAAGGIAAGKAAGGIAAGKAAGVTGAPQALAAESGRQASAGVAAPPAAGGVAAEEAAGETSTNPNGEQNDG